LNCTHCGREVKSTIHRKEGTPQFLVDYYLLFTGTLSKIIMQSDSEESETMEFYKLSQPRWVVTCCDCYKNDKIHSDLEDLFSGVPAEADTA